MERNTYDDLIADYEGKLREYGYGPHTQQLQDGLDKLREARLKMEQLRPIQYEVVFTEMMESGQVVKADSGKIYVPENKAYSFIFSMGGVSESNLKCACDHARQKVFRSIDKM